MAAIALGLASSVVWGLADYLGGLKSRTFCVPVVLAMMYLSSLAVMLAFVALRGEGPRRPSTCWRRWRPGSSGSPGWRRSTARLRSAR